MIKQNILFGIILIIAFALRVVALNQFPAGLNADEAAIGYNAYSIIKTGRDEYGEFLPLSFKSFGDYKPGLYFYFVLPFVAVLGLNEWAVRLPSAIFGVGLVALSFYLAKMIFKDRKISFFAALFLAVNPWAIHYSRGGWETNAAIFFISLGIYLFIKSLEEKIFLFWSLLSFLISMYLYQSPRLVVPVFIIAAAFLYRRSLISEYKKNIKPVIISIIVLAVLSVPLLMQFATGGGSARFAGLSIFSDTGPAMRINELRGQHENPQGIIPEIFHNKITAYLPNFLGHYLDHFSADFLFINGDPLIRNKIPETGQFYLAEALFLIAGMLFLIKYESKLKYLLLIWIVTAPLASAITYQTPHAVRAFGLVMPLNLIMAYGFVSLLRLIRTRRAKIFIGIMLLVILSFEFGRYLESYYFHYPKRYTLSWEDGFSEMVGKLNKYENSYDKIIITDRYDQPYILVLFYKKYDPARYQPQAVLSERDKFNYGTVRAFDKYEFHRVAGAEIASTHNTLFVISPEEYKDGMDVIDRVNFPDGNAAFLFIKS